MRLASVIHHASLAPAKSDRIFLTIPAIPPHSKPRRLTQSRFSLLSAASSLRLPPIACSRDTDQEDDVSSSSSSSSSSEKESRDLLPHKHDETGGLRDHLQQETYKTSFTTVALCVSAAVAFGIGIGLKDGVGKASEFFAGYLLEQSLSVDNLFVFVLVFKYFKVPLMYQVNELYFRIWNAGSRNEENLD